MSSFYELLKKIHKKPGIYIGSPSLSNLYMFLCGYSFSRQEQGIALTVEEQEFARFQGWIQQRFNVRASVSWAKIILFYSVDDRSGFETFFELWTEFVCQRRDNDEIYQS
jgi:hypothetical protein